MATLKNFVFNSPPLLEGLCQLRFEDNISLEGKLFNKFKKLISSQFPIIKERFYNIDEHIMEDTQTSSNVENVIQFKNEDTSFLVQIGENAIGINCINDTLDWKEFKEVVEFTLDHYLNVFKHFNVITSSLKLINKIDLPLGEENKVTVGEYLNFYPETPESLKLSTFRFHSSTTFLLAEEPNPISATILTQTIKTKDKDSISIILDIEISGQDLKEMDQFNQWMNFAGEKSDEIFKAAFTKKGKKLLNL